jgi:hypothetical protein
MIGERSYHPFGGLAMAKDNKAFVGIYLPKEVHRSLNSLASRMGVDITQVAADLVENGILEQLAYIAGTSDEVAPELALAQAYMKMRRTEQSRYQLVSLMINVIQAPTDDRQLDELVKLCETNGFELNEIKQQAQDMTRIHTSGIFNLGESDTQTERAVTFLTGLFKGANSISAKEIETKASQINIPLSVLKLAKRNLSLISVRKGTNWYWELPYMVAPNNVQVKL